MSAVLDDRTAYARTSKTDFILPKIQIPVSGYVRPGVQKRLGLPAARSWRVTTNWQPQPELRSGNFCAEVFARGIDLPTLCPAGIHKGLWCKVLQLRTDSAQSRASEKTGRTENEPSIKSTSPVQRFPRRRPPFLRILRVPSSTEDVRAMSGPRHG